MAKHGYDQTYENDRLQNEEDADLLPRAGRMLKAKLDEDLTGGAYVGSRLNMPSNTRLGKMSPADARLYNDSMAKLQEDRALESYGAKLKKSPIEKAYGMKKGGNVKSPTMSFQTYTETGKKAGMKTVPVKMAKGGKVSSASKRADGCCVKGKTKGRMV
jgi:hypothetical protein